MYYYQPMNTLLTTTCIEYSRFSAAATGKENPLDPKNYGPRADEF